MDEPVARADESDLGERRVHELVSEAHERALRRPRLPEHVEQVGPALDELEEAPVGVELLCPYLAEKVGGAADVEALLGRFELHERWSERCEEHALRGAEPGVLESPSEDSSSQL